MVKIWLLAALSTAAFGSTITYNYTGQNFTRCNGTTTGSFFCPSQSVFTTDYNQASFTFSAPLAGGLSSANELTSPNLSAWTLSDALGNASFSSTDVNAVNELTTLSLSTDNSGALTGWQIQGPAFAPGSGTPYFGMLNPTVLGKGSGLQEADSFVNTNPDGYALGNSTPGSWT